MQLLAMPLNILRQQTKLSNEKAKVPDRNSKKLFFPSMNSFKKWLLNLISHTIMNILLDMKATTGKPSEHLVKVIFGIESFRKNNGMYVAYKEGGVINSSDTVQFAPIIKDKKYIYGGKFSFRGILLFIDITPDGMNVPFEDIPGATEESGKCLFVKKI